MKKNLKRRPLGVQVTSHSGVNENVKCIGMSLIYSLPLTVFDIRDKWILLFPLSRLEYLFRFKQDGESI